MVMETRDLEEAASAVFKKESTPEVVRQAAREGWAPRLWSVLEQNGFARIGVEGSIAEAAAVVRVAARFAAPIPLAETVAAGWIIGDAPEGPLSVAHAGRAPYGRVARAIVIGNRFLTDFTLREGVNLADEPLDMVTPPGPDEPPLQGALVRSVQMAGALETVLRMTVEYAEHRNQFGRPLIAFQAIQQQLAEMAGEVSLAAAAADLAVRHFDAFHIAASRVTCGRSVTVSTAIAHQIHGAIGMTEEHDLNLFTRRLWSWRDDFGTEAYWTIRLGREVTSMGSYLWHGITSRSAANRVASE